MSLILDALRKADAERERGALPNLHSQPVHAAAEAPRKASAGANWQWIAFGAAFGLAAAVVWVMMSGRNAPAPSTATANPVPAPQGTAVATPVAPMAVTAPPSPPAAVTNVQDIAEPAPWPPPAERKAPGAAAKGEAPVLTLGNVLTAPPAVYSREQLPPDVRAALPQLGIGGSIYSPDPANRSLIINGRLYREKDRLTEELSLEEIKQRTAIFSIRGYRFEVVF
ncbi:MAG TPA: general secretion pathway protein GspB [Burkholderiaceae bacterium]|nr:general secretion pathway protein GspB [Burkholderiaceae bacterium]HQR70268.1 general secretion pathway protein GspB [Burkholderiaceae bacterium]